MEETIDNALVANTFSETDHVDEQSNNHWKS